MASADSDKFSAIFTQVESLHKQGTDQQLPRGRAVFGFCSTIFPLFVWTRRDVRSSARSMSVSAVCGDLLIS
jgi:hypothetical protein